MALGTSLFDAAKYAATYSSVVRSLYMKRKMTTQENDGLLLQLLPWETLGEVVDRLDDDPRALAAASATCRTLRAHVARHGLHPLVRIVDAVLRRHYRPGGHVPPALLRPWPASQLVPALAAAADVDPVIQRLAGLQAAGVMFAGGHVHALVARGLRPNEPAMAAYTDVDIWLDGASTPAQGAQVLQRLDYMRGFEVDAANPACLNLAGQPPVQCILLDEVRQPPATPLVHVIGTFDLSPCGVAVTAADQQLWVTPLAAWSLLARRLVPMNLRHPDHAARHMVFRAWDAGHDSLAAYTAKMDAHPGPVMGREARRWARMLKYLDRGYRLADFVAAPYTPAEREAWAALLEEEKRRGGSLGGGSLYHDVDPENMTFWSDAVKLCLTRQ